MKKLMLVVGAIALGFAANAECTWSWWSGGKDKERVVSGCQLGIACETKEITGAQVAILWNLTQSLKKGGTQVAIAFNRAKTVQNGPQVAFVNIADDAALQLGLLCFNDNGFLPFFPFFNFDTKMFGGDKAKK